MRLSEFDYPLPSDRIAFRPRRAREKTPLLDAANPERPRDKCMADLPELLRSGDVLVVNDTKVLPVRLIALGKARGGAVEVTLLEALGGGLWRALVKGASRLAVGEEIFFAPTFSARLQAREQGGRVLLQFREFEVKAFEAQLQKYGLMPLPPYIKRRPDARDARDYQTLFATREGAIAAPTAGRHFTPLLLERLQQKGVGCVSLTLHVGAGTFSPVRQTRVEDHAMEAERVLLSKRAAARIRACKDEGGRVVAVGTTVVRALEGVVRARGALEAYEEATDLYILPGFSFRVVDLLITNFHQPRSTPLILTCAFAGMQRVREAYRHACAKTRYRFLSYGDACLFCRGSDLGGT